VLRVLAKQRDGHYVRFSGVPDLCIYRLPAVAGVRAAGKETFMLSEVKSPTDRLSEKQRAMNDLLLRCGFAVDVCHVADAEDASTELIARGNSGVVGNRVEIGMRLPRSGSGDGADDDAACDGALEARRLSEAERQRLERRVSAAQQGQSRRPRNTPHSPTQV
jgi:hypothetical protein